MLSAYKAAHRLVASPKPQCASQNVLFMVEAMNIMKGLLKILSY